MMRFLAAAGSAVCAVVFSLYGAAVASGPEIAVTRAAGAVQIVFSGTLQSSENLDGPWTDLPDAISPLMLEPAASGKFYRSRQPDSIFASDDIVDLAFSGPFQAHFELAFAGMPDGIFPPVREKPYFDGTVRIGGRTLPITLRVRGNSSLQECPFPKLKFKIAKEQRPGTPFFDAREIKIGTHCAEGGRGSIGRLRDERSAFREALAYETMQALGFLSPRVRRARLEYHDTTPERPGEDANSTGWQVTRMAVLFDDVEVVAERLGGRALSDEEITALEQANFDPQLIADLHFLHILLGNWDYALSPDGTELWNTDVIELPGPVLLPMAGDFDLASWVTEKVVLSAPWDYHPELPPLERETRFKLEQLLRSVGSDRFLAAQNRFAAKRPQIESLIAGAEVDEAGRTNAQQHVTIFFKALEEFAKR